MPATPEARLASARAAFKSGDFARLRPLLAPILVPDAKLTRLTDRIDARQLLGVGLFFEAQQVTDATKRRDLLEQSRVQFLELLREKPDYNLDPLLYPASVVEIFDGVRRDHAEELDTILEQQNGTAGGERSTETIYIERRVQRRNYALNFFPFGIGQFQNQENVKGTLFAVGQVLALGLNVTSYVMVENLRGSDGYYDPGADRTSGDYESALTWRNVMYGSLAGFAVLYAGSVLDAVLNFEDADIHIRALDAPPPELGPGEPSGTGMDLPLGWSLELQF